ncbi:fibrinogen-binding MSCRAMM adhesin Fss3 [Listeria monocytogenes]|uniref:fibrinogen-binding MSCRAMM adhesin Fss3 n=1 Tax=Listeria monocytogenes TaxID=1639 RepID=UPI00086AC95A|nr:fibrinogen-binding MSCRAMM adhesin Fss3 [Listeria monocytogenes]HAP4465925.1 fibrinogen-binding MSCRAMM adhesin Fss3 [Enterococcus faecalis]EAG9449622.1 LPXTG cell wall anchor domain-containing protein [Listeria monocytogenes]EHF6375922.1 fibrinogen-binding MSCRAMM adhesin Fss3 [Listeria monocytogenes]EIZ6565602.1 fibrinogen-binding MSCRAMM adhesin Fss3 [Listeria monocytogenes]EIZ6570118.1 fibrinogen-binding MSCRAMM adhesin Fss3 [Listeria monocytogenes]
MKKLRFKNWRLFATLALLGQTIGGAIGPTIAFADEITHPQTVTVHCDLSHLYSVEGTFSDGRTLSEVTVPHYAIYNGEKQDIFCIEPGVPIYNEFTPGYEKNPLPDMSEKAKLVSVLWKNAGTDIDTQMVAQKMIWQEVNGYTLHSMKHPDGSAVNIPAIEAKINQAIADYQKKPSFHNSTAKTVLGQSTTVTDTNNLNLSEFDDVVENTANIDYRVNGNQLVITPNTNSKESGVLTLKKSAGTGTPVAYKMAGQQTLMAGAIDKPNTYTIKIDVETKGSLKIKKVDKESGDVVPGTIFHLEFGKTLPAKDVTTDKEGIATLDGIPHGTKVTITEKSVPAPYTIDTTPMTAMIKAGETISVTSKNTREKGQIILDKTGVETGNDLWNDNYSLAGNTFAIRKDSPTGEIIQEMTTDEKGHAETPKEIADALELGTYYVTETKAANGFVNTFKPVKVELEYANQTVALVTSNVKGQNQEITGETTLTKEDKDTGNETQGKAEFKGAEYTLFTAKDGQAVKWGEAFKPELVKGTKASDETVTLTLDEKNQAAVKHLVINEYYWQETKAPEGYTLDETKYPVSIKKVDDSEKNAVITRDVTAKEQVIRFVFDFFKFAGSAAGTAETGFNDLTFKVSPLEGTNEITGAEDEATTAYNEQLGFDGYGKFENLPYGDYLLEEVEAPEGFQKITPLEIRSTFKENKEDYTKSEYMFTITEQGQKQPIKTVTVPYEKLTSKEFSVSLNRLMLYDLPEEEDSLTSLATWKDGDKEMTTLDSTELVDKLSYNLHEIKEDWYIVAQAIDVEATKAAQEKDEKAKPVVIAETTATLANKEKTGTWEILHKLTAEQVLDKTIVLFNYVYENKEAYEAGDDPLAKDATLNNQAQTVKSEIDRRVSIQTKAHLEDGSQTFTHGDVVAMFDDVSITHDVLDGSKEAFETILYALLPDGTNKEIWKSGKIDYEVNDKEFTKTVLAEKVDTSKYPEGTSFTFKEINYDKDGNINGKHNEDLKEKSQTLTPKKVPTTPSTPEQPETPTVSSDTPESSPTVKTFPQTGEEHSNVLLFIGFTLIFATAGYYFWNRRN